MQSTADGLHDQVHVALDHIDEAMSTQVTQWDEETAPFKQFVMQVHTGTSIDFLPLKSR